MRIWVFLAISLALACGEVSFAQTQLPAANVVFTDQDDLQFKWDDGQLGGGGAPVYDVQLDLNGDGKQDTINVTACYSEGGWQPGRSCTAETYADVGAAIDALVWCRNPDASVIPDCTPLEFSDPKFIRVSGGGQFFGLGGDAGTVVGRPARSWLPTTPDAEILVYSNMQLECDGSTLLTGARITNTSADLSSWSVIQTYSDIDAGRAGQNVNIQISNCGIDVGAPDGFNLQIVSIDTGPANDVITFKEFYNWPAGHFTMPQRGDLVATHLRNGNRCIAGDGTIGDACTSNAQCDGGTPASGVCRVREALPILSNTGNTITVQGSFVNPPAPGDLVAISYDGDTGAVYSTRRGIVFNDTKGGKVYNNRLQNSYHTLFYTRDTQDLVFTGNDFSGCSMPFRLQGNQGQPCFYSFSIAATPSQAEPADHTVFNTIATNNTFRNVTSRVFNHRSDDSLPFENLNYSNNVIEASISAIGQGATCFVVNDARRMVIEGNVADRCDIGISTGSRTSLRIDGNLFTRVHGIGVQWQNTSPVGAIEPGEFYLSDTSFEFETELLTGTNDGVAIIVGDDRDSIIIENVTVMDPGRHGLRLTGVGDATRFDRLRVDGLTVRNAGTCIYNCEASYGVYLQLAAPQGTIANLDIRGSRDANVRLGSSMQDVSLRDWYLDARYPHYQGILTKTSADAAYPGGVCTIQQAAHHFIVSDGDCPGTPGGTGPTWCRCEDTRVSEFTQGDDYTGVFFSVTASVFERLHWSNITVSHLINVNTNATNSGNAFRSAQQIAVGNIRNNYFGTIVALSDETAAAQSWGGGTALNLRQGDTGTNRYDWIHCGEGFRGNCLNSVGSGEPNNADLKYCTASGPTWVASGGSCP